MSSISPNSSNFIRGRGGYRNSNRGRGGTNIVRTPPTSNVNENSQEISQVPQIARDLLVKWIIGSATQEKIDIGMTKTGGKFANIYSWASGDNSLPTGANEKVRRQYDAIHRSYIMDNNVQYHKTRVYLSEPSVIKSIEEHFGGKYRVHLRKIGNNDTDSLIKFRWIVQLETVI
jgi:hypothetical protein